MQRCSFVGTEQLIFYSVTDTKSVHLDAIKEGRAGEIMWEPAHPLYTKTSADENIVPLNLRDPESVRLFAQTLLDQVESANNDAKKGEALRACGLFFRSLLLETAPLGKVSSSLRQS